MTHPTATDIAREISPLRTASVHHRAFAAVRTLEDLRVFMEAHVFAVWDFMSLVKRLQADLTVQTLPWIPPRWPRAARLINDIVIGEETDIGLDGNPSSHFEMYLRAMNEVGANTEPVTTFVSRIADSTLGGIWNGLHEVFADLDVPRHVQDFVEHTIQTACFGSTAEVLGSFFYGREDVIPNMFQQLLDARGLDADTVPELVYYLERHIELDADEHGPAAEAMLDELLTADRSIYGDVTNAARAALISRQQLWDGVATTLTATGAQIALA